MTKTRACLYAPCLAALALLGNACTPADFTYADGSSGRFSDWHGDWVLVNYWAEWCAPCRQEIPELNALDADDSLNVRVIGVNFDGLRDAELRDLVERMQIAFPVVIEDPNVPLGYERPGVLPTTFVIDPEGQVVDRLEGPQTHEMLEAALGEAGADVGATDAGSEADVDQPETS